MAFDKKAKLRTASDVISRLRWSQDENKSDSSLIVMGYTDRIEGTLEKAVKDFISARTTGDIPEHRILYFRYATDKLTLEDQILWDRSGRVDKIFLSGNGSAAPIAIETLQAVKEAKQNMIRIEEEQEIRRQEKAKLRARRARKRELTRMKLENTNAEILSTENDKKLNRFQWEEAPWYIYSRDKGEWTSGKISDEKSGHRKNYKEEEDLVVVTWNVLFDIFDGGLESEGSELSSTNDTAKFQQARWESLASTLHQSKPDLLSLQEATPAFVKVLLDCEWVKSEYSCSASPSHLESVSPSGVLLLWCRSTVAPHSKNYALFRCSDYGRNRSLTATVVPDKAPSGSVLAFGSTHLPADKVSGDSDKSPRGTARKRELSSILGHIQRLGGQLKSVTPILAGDFNCDDDELIDGLFAGCSDDRFQDVWPECEKKPGLTFDPVNNPRAARSSALVGGSGRSKRIDRIFIGPTHTCHGLTGTSKYMTPRSASLLGNEMGKMPPSDHYGVRASFQRKSDISKSALAPYPPSGLWSANAPPSPHYILAIMLDNPKLQRLKATHDPQSSLPALHVTLLHGFVEADFGCLDLVKSALQETIDSINSSVPPPASVRFTKETSLSVFEHRASATLVAHPDTDSQGEDWLSRLYVALRERFRLCNEQERHSSTGWNPHMTMGVSGSSSAARQTQSTWIADGTWNTHEESAAIHSVDVMTRGSSGKFQTLLSLPVSTNSLPRTVEDFLLDAGTSMSQHMDQLAARMLSRLTRVCREVVRDYPLEVSVREMGSHLLKTALPELSDLDVAVVLRPRSEENGGTRHLREFVSGNSFLQRLAVLMTEEFLNSKARLRPGGGTTVLTMRVPDFPSLDIHLCCLDREDKPIDNSSNMTLGAIHDGEAIMKAFSQQDLASAVQGAVRILKLWANHHGVYGSATGFLGGSGWAVWLLRCLTKGMQSGDLHLDLAADSAEVSRQMACYFFEETSMINHLSEPIALTDSHHESVPTVVPFRPGTLSVLAPSSNGDFGRSSTLATTQTTLLEISAAASTLQECDYDLNSILTTQSLVDSVLKFPFIIVFELLRNTTASLQTKPAEIKAWGCQKFLDVLSELERDGNSTEIRPAPKPLRLKNDGLCNDNSTLAVRGFIWWMGLRGRSEDVSKKVRAMEPILARDATAIGVQCQLRILSSTDAVSKLASEGKDSSVASC